MEFSLQATRPLLSQAVAELEARKEAAASRDDFVEAQRLKDEIHALQSQANSCSKGCGRPAFGKFPTCCTKCKGADGPHKHDCRGKASAANPEVPSAPASALPAARGVATAVPLPSAPPSAPSLAAQLITNAELSTIVAMLQTEASNGFESQMRALRIQLFGKVVHQGHVKKILREINQAHRVQALRELYERQLIIDSSQVESRFAEMLVDGHSMGLEASEGAALKAQVDATAQQALRFLPQGSEERADALDPFALASAPPSEFAPSAPPADRSMPAPSAPPLATQAFLLMHYDGKVSTVVGNPATMNVTGILAAACQNLGVPEFDPSRHYALMVWPGRYVLSDLTSSVAMLGIPSWARILWLEMPVDEKGKKAADPRVAGLRFQQVRSSFFSLSQSGQMKISKAELRNFFWNLNLGDSVFMHLWQRLDTRSRGFLDIDDLLHLVGRAHMQHPMVPIDALLYEAASVIISSLGAGQPGAGPVGEHFDIAIAEVPHGIGAGRACQMHACSYIVSCVLQLGIPILLVLFILKSSQKSSSSHHHTSDSNMGQDQQFGIAAAVAYIVYLIHAFCCTKFASAVGNRITGLNEVCNIVERPKSEHPHYRWHIQCYHMETRHRQESYTDGEGRQQTRTVTETHRVNTWHNTHNGVIPSVDRTATFVPDTTALVTEIDTFLDMDFSQSNYLFCYRHWCMANRHDIHADESHSEWLPSRKDAFLAEWVAGARPCWQRRTAYVFATLFLFSMCFRWAVQSKSGYQKFVYRKICYQIAYSPQRDRCHASAAALIGGITAGMAIASVMGGAYVY